MARNQQQAIQWLPASWTICLLTALLSITAFVNKYVPDSYMVSMLDNTQYSDKLWLCVVSAVHSQMCSSLSAVQIVPAAAITAAWLNSATFSPSATIHAISALHILPFNTPYILQHNSSWG